MYQNCTSLRRVIYLSENVQFNQEGTQSNDGSILIFSVAIVHLHIQSLW